MGCKKKEEIAAPYFVGLAMTIHMIKLEVIAMIPMKSGDEAIPPPESAYG